MSELSQMTGKLDTRAGDPVLCLLIGHYEMLAMTLNTLRVQLDPPGRRIG